MNDKEILDRIDELLKENGEISDRTKTGLLQLAMYDIRDGVKELKEENEKQYSEIKVFMREHRDKHLQIERDIEELQRTNPFRWAKENKILAITIILLFLAASDIIKGILLLLGVPSSIVP